MIRFLVLPALLVCSTHCLAADSLSFEHDIRPALQQYCGDCHAPDDPKNHVNFLKAARPEDLSGMRSLWGSAAEQLRNRTMPPPDEEQPTEEQRLAIADWISTRLRETACEQGPYAGMVTSRRLNRSEYQNTIRDLLGVEIDVNGRFPADGSGGEGFDNNGETLFLPPLLLERYLETTDEILGKVLPATAIDVTFSGRDLNSAADQNRDTKSRLLEPGQAAEMVLRIFGAGEYEIVVDVAAVDQASHVSLKVDGIVAERFEVPAPRENQQRSPIQGRCRIDLVSGFHQFSVQCSGNASIEVDALRIRLQREPISAERRARFEKLTGTQFGSQPEDPLAAARAALKRFLPQAFRRPAIDGEVDRYLALFDRGQERGDPYEENLRLAIKAVIVSTPFLFRLEDLPKSTNPEPIGQYEMASRLSYFLWGTMPDEQLFELARTNQLADPAVLAAQVERMIADPRIRYFVEEFTGQWLGTREVGGRVAPDTSKFQNEFTTELLLGFREEPIQLVHHVLKNDRPLLELITADYVIANSRLLKHYGLTEEKGDQKEEWPWSPAPSLEKDGPFMLVEAKDGTRGGLLGMGGVHLLTSYPTRTSPVLRGGWILETLLGVHIPNPPPDVPELSKSKKGKMTVREQLAMHRDHAACSACHNLIDPPGFALEHYDVLGRWRDEQEGGPVDATATFPSGEEVDGLPGLKKLLQERKSEFYLHFSRKLLGFALGRSLEDRDDCAIQQVMEGMLNRNESLRGAIVSVVLSTPFGCHQLEEES
ncbi:MAG: DUF1592 domain-containing protein, partial [Planctomycetaceae bacterium]|nr:DUF1592 domain-containing protein [Planctomycetaceae bacterium]